MAVRSTDGFDSLILTDADLGITVLCIAAFAHVQLSNTRRRSIGLTPAVFTMMSCDQKLWRSEENPQLPTRCRVACVKNCGGCTLL